VEAQVAAGVDERARVHGLRGGGDRAGGAVSEPATATAAWIGREKTAGVSFPYE
jgi:hypothetical protein